MTDPVELPDSLDSLRDKIQVPRSNEELENEILALKLCNEGLRKERNKAVRRAAAAERDKPMLRAIAVKAAKLQCQNPTLCGDGWNPWDCTACRAKAWVASRGREPLRLKAKKRKGGGSEANGGKERQLSIWLVSGNAGHAISMGLPVTISDLP